MASFIDRLTALQQSGKKVEFSVMDKPVEIRFFTSAGVVVRFVYGGETTEVNVDS